MILIDSLFHLVSQKTGDIHSNFSIPIVSCQVCKHDIFMKMLNMISILRRTEGLPVTVNVEK